VIVVDTNVIAYLFLPGDFAPQAEAWLKLDRDWAAPILWRSELRNLLAGYLRRKQLTFEAVREIQGEAEALLLGNEHDVDSQRVFDLVRDSDCSAYDCEFVSVGMRLGVKLLTADKKVLKAFPQHTIPFSAASARGV
jgi:predicted nucleic acid-binding protein